MRWRITIEGMDEFGGRGAAEMVIEKDFGRLSKGEIASTVLRDICPDHATPELMELSARMGNLMPHERAATRRIH